MKYNTFNGELVNGNSPLEIVQDLRNGSKFCSDQNEAEFMKGFAERLKRYSGDDIRFDSPENFVADLIEKNALQAI